MSGLNEQKNVVLLEEGTSIPRLPPPHDYGTLGLTHIAGPRSTLSKVQRDPQQNAPGRRESRVKGSRNDPPPDRTSGLNGQVPLRRSRCPFFGLRLLVSIVPRGGVEKHRGFVVLSTSVSLTSIFGKSWSGV